MNFSNEEKAILFLFFHLLAQVIIEECRILGLKCENFRIVNKNICDKNGFIGLKFKLPYADSEKSAELALKVYNRIKQSTLDRKLIKNTFKILTKEFNKKLKKHLTIYFILVCITLFMMSQQQNLKSKIYII